MRARSMYYHNKNAILKLLNYLTTHQMFTLANITSETAFIKRKITDCTLFSNVNTKQMEQNVVTDRPIQHLIRCYILTI